MGGWKLGLLDRWASSTKQGKFDIKFTENVAKRKKVSDEKEGPRDRALGDT